MFRVAMEVSIHRKTSQLKTIPYFQEDRNLKKKNVNKYLLIRFVCFEKLKNVDV